MGDNTVTANELNTSFVFINFEFPTKTIVLMEGRAFSFEFGGFCWFVL